MAMPVPPNTMENQDEYVYHVDNGKYQKGLEERRQIIQNHFLNNDELYN